MTSQHFILWLKGFSEACHEFHPTPKQWDRIKEVLSEVQDYDDNPGWDDEIGDYPTKFIVPLSGSLIGSSANGTLTTDSTRNTNTIWNDQMGCWYYTNYREGFGYYTNSTADSKKEKQQLND